MHVDVNRMQDKDSYLLYDILWKWSLSLYSVCDLPFTTSVKYAYEGSQQAGEQSSLLRGEGGEGGGGERGGRKRSRCNLKREIQIPINAVHEKR